MNASPLKRGSGRSDTGELKPCYSARFLMENREIETVAYLPYAQSPHTFTHIIHGPRRTLLNIALNRYKRKPHRPLQAVPTERQFCYAVRTSDIDVSW